MNRLINILHRGVFAQLGWVPLPGDTCQRLC